MYINNSYKDHENHIINIFSKEIDERLKPYYQTDAENEQLLYPFKIIKPFFEDKNTWLTVGDYTGFEAYHLLKNNQDATASDISDAFLIEVKKRNLIKEYKKINAEAIDLPDNSFDYVVCKEMLHHLPRPFTAIHEMLRVAKKAVIALCEPVDMLSKISLLVFAKNLLDKIDPLLINKIWKNRFSYESFFEDRPINYVYKFSEREIEKLAAALKLPLVAFYEMNYNVSKTYEIISKLKIIPKGQFSFIIFKEKPNEEFLKKLRQMKFKLLHLPQN
ncbi:MAG: class I SAM-dependent methyltransferase [Ignavibacterium sp.]|nr:class I SAM-dependent methyltransferase [Ignavibacterium sp.]MDW8374433.1 class I SAM-dependent methyltransferase [Ignavibacteriales bacterium]